MIGCDQGGLWDGAPPPPLPLKRSCDAPSDDVAYDPPMCVAQAIIESAAGGHRAEVPRAPRRESPRSQAGDTFQAIKIFRTIHGRERRAALFGRFELFGRCPEARWRVRTARGPELPTGHANGEADAEATP